MLNFFKKKVNNQIFAPVKGRCFDIAQCKDMTFAKKLLGDGFLVEPEDDIVCSPVDGTLTMVFPTKHAFGIKMNNGLEILVHIGIDTVNLQGEYFELLEEKGKKVKKGTPIIKCNMKKLCELGYDNSVLVVVPGNDSIVKKHLNEAVDKNEIIIEV